LKPAFELAQVIDRFGKEYQEQYAPNAYLQRTLSALQRCRTAALGGHIDKCDHCGHIRISYNSCRNRHCPKCQNTQREAWIENRKQDLLPVPYFHVVFTVPDKLNRLFLQEPVLMYNLLFQAAWQTLAQFSYTRLHAETGMFAVLHTWGQNLSLHPHIHCIVPAAGYSLSGKWRQIGKYEDYLYPVHQLSAAFKGKFLDSMRRELRKQVAIDGFKARIEKAYQKKWVVYCESSLAEAEHVIRYLGQYTHRIAISNQRILNVNSTHVTFVAKDYRDRAQQKPVSLKGEEFLRRFCLHVMPDGYVRIRRFGIYHHSTKRHLDLQFVPDEKPDIDQLMVPKKKETASERILRLTGIDVTRCPHCKKGRLIVIRTLPRIRSPAGHLPSMLLTKLL